MDPQVDRSYSARGGLDVRGPRRADVATHSVHSPARRGGRASKKGNSRFDCVCRTQLARECLPVVALVAPARPACWPPSTLSY